MNVGIGTEATQFPEKEYINGIFFAMLSGLSGFIVNFPYPVRVTGTFSPWKVSISAQVWL